MQPPVIRVLSSLLVLMTLLAIAPAAAGTGFGRVVVGEGAGEPRNARPDLAPDVGNPYSVEDWTVAGIHAGDFIVVGGDTGMQQYGQLYNYATARVVFRPTGLGERDATLQMHWTSYRIQDGKLVPARSGVATTGLSGYGVMRDPEPGTGTDSQPTFCIASDDNPKAVNGRINGSSGNAQIVAKDPIRTRGYPLTLDITINTQDLGIAGAMGNAAFTYGIAVKNLDYTVESVRTEHWLVIDADGAVLDFGTGVEPGAPARGIYSSLSRKPDGSFVLAGAGTPGSLRRYGNYTYFFNSAGQLTRLQDPAGNSQLLTYVNGRLSRVDDVSSKKAVRFTHSSGRIATIIENGGQVLTRLTYSSGRLIRLEVLNADGSATTRTDYTYSNGLLSTVTRDGDPTTTATFTYTTFPTVRSNSGVRKVNVSTAEFTSHFDWSQNSPVSGAARIDMADSKGAVTTMLVSKAGDVLSVQPPQYVGGTGDTTFRMTYDGNHNVTSITGPNVARNLAYDSHGQLVRARDGTGSLTTYDYNGADLKRASDVLGTVLEVFYDNPRFPHVPTRVVDGEGHTWTAVLNGFGQVLTLKPPTGSSGGAATIRYDEQSASPNYGWPTLLAQNSVTLRAAGYTRLGDLAGLTSSPDGKTPFTTALAYDGAQRVTRVTHPDGRFRLAQYSGRNLASVTDEAGVQTFFDWCGACGGLNGVRGPLGWSNTLTRDSDRNVTGFTDARGKLTVYTYGANGEMARLRYPDGSGPRYEYYSNGRLHRTYNGRGQLLTYVYDKAGRLTSRRGAGISETLTYYRDGRLRRVDAGSYSLVYAYTPSRRVESVTMLVNTAGMSSTQVTSYTYYPDGKVASLTWLCNGQQAAAWSYVYGAAGRLASVTNSLGEVTQYRYDGQGKLLRQINANGTTTVYTYNNARGWPVRIAQQKGAAALGDYRLFYDGGLDRVPLLTGVSELGGSAAAYEYDPLRRLTRAQRSGLGAGSETYTYDLAGNLTRRNGVVFGAYDAANKCVSSPLGKPAYDTDGNTLNLGGTAVASFSWNVDSRMTAEASGGRAVQYTYDLFGRRLTAREGTDPAALYVFSGDALIGEVRNGQPSAVYTWGDDGLVSQRLPGAPGGAKSYWYHFGPQGETRTLTDAAGTVAAGYLYSPYGVTLAATGAVTNPFRYGGKFGCYQQGPNGLVLCGRRWYHPGLTRWMSRDPAGYSGGSNLYAYVTSNPVNQVDPDGQSPISPWDALDVGFFVADLHNLYNEPSWANAGWAGLGALGVLPWVPSVGVISGASRAVKGTHAQTEAAGAIAKGCDNLPAPYYPPNNGFAGAAASHTLMPGDQIIRFGDETGRFASTYGTSAGMLSLPPGLPSGRLPSVYTVLQPLPVQSGQAAAWFGQLGGGTQHLLPLPVDSLVQGGFLR